MRAQGFSVRIRPRFGEEPRSPMLDAQRLRTLASVFGIVDCSYVVMSEHLHVVLRVRPDLVSAWTDDQVVLRWRRLSPPSDPATGRPTEAQEHDLTMIASNPALVAELRRRLASLSWFMRCLNEPIARMRFRRPRGLRAQLSHPTNGKANRGCGRGLPPGRRLKAIYRSRLRSIFRSWIGRDVSFGPKTKRRIPVSFRRLTP